MINHMQVDLNMQLFSGLHFILGLLVCFHVLPIHWKFLILMMFGLRMKMDKVGIR